MVAIDIQPNASVQVKEGNSVLNVGGFADTVFEVVSSYVSGELDAGHWVGEIEKVDIGSPSPIIQAVKNGVKKTVAKKMNAKLKRDRSGRFR